MKRGKTWVLALALVAFVTYVCVVGLEKEMSRIEVVPDEEVLKPIMVGDFPEDPTRWEFDDAHAFFVEYRLERDRIRGQELEMLRDMINNLQVGEEARREAERQVLSLVDLMEKELIVENMLKAQGYADALLFTGRGAATIMIYTEKLSEEEFLKITEMVSAITGVSREQVEVIQHS